MPKVKKRLVLSEPEELIPELRFPEFKNEGEWETNSIGEVFKSFSGGTPSTSERTYYGGHIPFIRSAEIKKDETELFLTEEGIKKSSAKLVNKGDLLVALYGANSGDSAISKINGAINQAILCLQSEYSNTYTYNFLTLKKDWIVSKFIQGGQGNLSGDIVKSISIPFPKKKEQQKIASCLLSLDDLIEAHNQKLELLKDHKKGLMQNLFTQEGEKVPKYCFREFKKDGAWIKETVGDVYDFKVTNSFAREYLNYKNGTVKNIHYGDIHTKFNTLFDITKEDVPYINPDVSIEKIRKECYCIVGDIVFADASEDMNDVGKSIEIINLNKEKLVSGLHTLLARQKKKKLAIGFGGYLFKSDWVRKQIQREAQGAKVLGISATRISNVQILYPKNHNEQEAISLCLSSLDEIIKAQEDKIEQLKKHKKGLMQGLFPKMID
jgi:type I restriction enzyme S subunit